jgi:uroporphyrinogen-III synthase/uroporphyrinogen III methyltransferase/synthase
VLLPRSDRARPELPDALRHRGYRVTEVIAYRTVTLPVPAETARALATGGLDAVLLTSPSTAAAVAEVPVAAGVIVVAIGASTAAAARDAGLAVTATATQPSAPGLVEALAGAAVTDTPPRT